MRNLDEDYITYVVVVDDDEMIRHVIGTMVEHGLQCKVNSFADAQTALDYITSRGAKKSEPVDAILCDIRMPGMTGHEFLLEMRSAGYDIPVVFLTGFVNENTLSHALRLGAFDVVAKPPQRDILIPTMEIATNVGRRRRIMWSELFAMKKRLAEGDFTDEIAYDLTRAIEEVQKEYRMTALLALRNHALKGD